MSMRSFVFLCLLLAAASVRADKIPVGSFAKNFEAIGYSDLAGMRGFKLAVKEFKGRWYLYTGRSTGGWLILDVTDPRDPKLVKKLEGPANTNTVQVSLHGDLLITAVQVALQPDWDLRPDNPLRKADKVSPPDISRDAPYDEGLILWDISNPIDPKKISQWRAGDKGLSGIHRASYPGGRYAYVATDSPGYRGKILVILDVSDPRRPTVAGRWFNPDQKLPAGVEDPNQENGFHGPPMISADGKVAVAAYAPNLVNLDISDISNPKKIGNLQFTPPFLVTYAEEAHFAHLHSALPFWNRKIVAVLGEMPGQGCDKGVSFVALVDNKDLSRPKLMSVIPKPMPSAEEGYADYCEKGGYVGPHNFNQETHSPDVLAPDNLLFVSYFNAGLRVYDISNPYVPRESGYFVPPQPTVRTGWAPSTKLVTTTEDVLVDRRGYIYITDKQWGIYVLRYTGPLAKEMTSSR